MPFGTTEFADNRHTLPV